LSGSFTGGDVGGLYSSSYGSDYISRGSDVNDPDLSQSVRHCAMNIWFYFILIYCFSHSAGWWQLIFISVFEQGRGWW